MATPSHLPLVQVAPAKIQLCPQEPQLLASLTKFTHEPPQKVVPVAQGALQAVPDWHPVGGQFVTVGVTHAPPEHLDWSVNLPFEQLGPGGHGIPFC